MFQELSVQEFTINPFQKIGKQWMLITAGDESGYNTMTASWGGLGVLWQRNVRSSVWTLQQIFVRQTIDYTLH